MESMFSKVLIANRGEIACRVIRTCRRLGISTVAIYSEADEKALHVRMADEAFRVGPAPAAESYLRIDRIVGVARRTKADAIHPGYGFLSENPRFVEMVEAAGISFVGPQARIIGAMGDKVEARRQAEEAGVPVVPGTGRAIEDVEAVPAARAIGYPLMIKAVDGGGGMGIRFVHEEGELVAALARARGQAQSAFGSAQVYMERYIPGAAHIEVQIIGDHYGNVVHLFERDCSVQRRHQKVVEETPSPKLSDSQRQEIAVAAVRMAQRIGYTNAGTVEFLLAPDGRFYFLEVNTRLQVEHPVTEMVTGQDLVELQLRVAAGERLPITQNLLGQRGHAIEARIYPEDPETLLPSYGTVEALEEPDGKHVRVDGALRVGYEVQPYYEPLMAKVIVWGEDREAAIGLLRETLMRFTVEGVLTNIPLITRLLSHPLFATGTHDTTFLEQLLEEPATASTGHELVAAIAVATVMSEERLRQQLPTRWKVHSRRQAMLNRLSGGTV